MSTDTTDDCDSDLRQACTECGARIHLLLDKSKECIGKAKYERLRAEFLKMVDKMCRGKSTENAGRSENGSLDVELKCIPCTRQEAQISVALFR
jgi:hypothetical protein